MLQAMISCTKAQFMGLSAEALPSVTWVSQLLMICDLGVSKNEICLPCQHQATHALELCLNYRSLLCPGWDAQVATGEG